MKQKVMSLALAMAICFNLAVPALAAASDFIIKDGVLTEYQGGGYNYFKLRDLGAALGFNVGWSKEQGVFIESDKPYAE